MTTILLFHGVGFFARVKVCRKNFSSAINEPVHFDFAHTSPCNGQLNGKGSGTFLVEHRERACNNTTKLFPLCSRNESRPSNEWNGRSPFRLTAAGNLTCSFHPFLILIWAFMLFKKKMKRFSTQWYNQVKSAKLASCTSQESSVDGK